MRSRSGVLAAVCTLAFAGVVIHGQTSLPSRPVQLLASQTLAATAPVTLTPTDPSAVETLNGPTIFDVTMPRDRARTHFTLSVNQSFNWHQVPNGVPYLFSANLRVFVSSNVLPAPGSFEALGIFAESEQHADSSAGSAADVTRSVGFQRQVTFDVDAMVINLRFAFPAMTDAERQTLAVRLLGSRIRLTIQPQARVRSVDRVVFGRIRALHVWGG